MPSRKPTTRAPIKTLNDATRAHFYASDLKEIIGLTPGQVKVWTERGLISTQSTPGTGKYKEFTLFNLIEAYAALKMSQMLKTALVEESLAQIRAILAGREIDIAGLVNPTSRAIFAISMNESKEIMPDGTPRGEYAHVRLYDPQSQQVMGPAISIHLDLTTVALAVLNAVSKSTAH